MSGLKFKSNQLKFRFLFHFSTLKNTFCFPALCSTYRSHKPATTETFHYIETAFFWKLKRNEV